MVANDNPPPLPVDRVTVSVREYSWGERGTRLGIAIELPEGADDAVLTPEAASVLGAKLIIAIGRADRDGPTGEVTDEDAGRGC